MPASEGVCRRLAVSIFSEKNINPMKDLNIAQGTVRVKRGDMDYIKFGSGEKAFVIICGMNMTGLAGLAGPVSEAYGMFAEEYTVYLLDRLKVLPEGYTVREMAEDTAEIMRALGIENADVMGNSQGGMIAECIAIDNPGLVHSLVLSSSMSHLTGLGSKVLSYWAELADRKDGREIYREFFKCVYGNPDHELLAILENTATDEQCVRYGVMARACLSFDVRDELKKIKCPVLVVGSDYDNVLGGEISRELAEELGCELFMYNNQKFGHAVCDEAPDFKQRMMDFFHSLDY